MSGSPSAETVARMHGEPLARALSMRSFIWSLMEIISHLPERSNYKRSGPGSNCFNYAESQQFYGFETAKLLETMHSIHCHQLTLAMLHRFPRHLHSRLRGKNETIAQRLGSRQSFARFLRRVFGGDGLFGA